MHWVPPYPEFCGGVRNGLLRPITRIRNDDGEPIDLSIFVFIRNRCKCVPFEEGLCGYLETVKGLHWTVLEVESDGVIGEDFWVDIAATKARPREQGATG